MPTASSRSAKRKFSPPRRRRTTPSSPSRIITTKEDWEKRRPELKVLYTSGYNDSGANLTSVAGSRYLQKPYAMEELARTLRDLLDSEDSADSAVPAGSA